MTIDRLQWMLAAVLLSLALVLGGGQGTLGDSLCQGLALVLMVLTLWRHQSDTGARLPKLAGLALLPLALPLLQLMVLPDALWQQPSARVGISAELLAAGVVVPSRPSLTPLATERALYWLLPGVALFLALLQFNQAQRGRLLQLFAMIALVAVVLGIAQLAGGAESPLRFYEVTNPNGAVGFFANRNHHAMLMAMALPFVLIGSARRLTEHGGIDVTQGMWLVAGGGLAALLILGIAIANSRAGVLLGMLALLLSVPAVLALRRRRGTRRFLAIAVAVGLMLVVQFALFGLLQRFGTDPLDDARFRFAPLVAQAASEHAPLGTGLGGFRRAFEAVDRAEPGSEYVNHAHNDYAELWLEGGWLAGVLGVLLLSALIVAGLQAWWLPSGDRAERALRRGASIALLLVLLHSIADYPLRTTAHLALFGLLAACLVRTSPTHTSSMAHAES